MSKQDFSKYLVSDVAVITEWIVANVPFEGIIRSQDLFAAVGDKLVRQCSESTFKVYFSHSVSANYFPMLVGLRPYGYRRVIGDVPAPSNKRRKVAAKASTVSTGGSPFIDTFASGRLKIRKPSASANV